MIDINKNYKLYDYILFENDQRVEDIFKLTLYEASIKNYAFKLNRVNKFYKLKSDLAEYHDNENTIMILPKDK